jgi:phosphate starvation-inducible membrane PsiE
MVRPMVAPQADKKRWALSPDGLASACIVAIEYAVVASLLLVAGIVLGRTLVAFLDRWDVYPQSVVSTIDGILVVIILLDIAHTVITHLRSAVFPVRPFLMIGVLAGVRDILSASAHLALSSSLPKEQYHESLISLAVGVGVVLFLLLGLLILRFAERGRPEED